jgi:hypothetical protein
VFLDEGDDIWGEIHFGTEGDQVMPELKLLSEQIEQLNRVPLVPEPRLLHLLPSTGPIE